MSYVLWREKHRATLMGTTGDPETLDDLAFELRPDDIVGGKPVALWPEGVTAVADADVDAFMTMVNTAPEAPPAVTAADQAVVYEEDQAIAYFNAGGQAVRREMATWAKVWGPDGTLTVVSLVDSPEVANGNA